MAVGLFVRGPVYTSPCSVIIIYFSCFYKIYYVHVVTLIFLQHTYIVYGIVHVLCYSLKVVLMYMIYNNNIYVHCTYILL